MNAQRAAADGTGAAIGAPRATTMLDRPQHGLLGRDELLAQVAGLLRVGKNVALVPLLTRVAL